MRLKSLHTTWLTLFTTLMLLVSSVANSAPLMNIQMMSNGVMNHGQSMMMDNSEHCGMPGMMDVSITEDGEVRESRMNCGGGSGMVHTCCTAACSLVFLPLPVPVNRALPIVYRAAITPEVISPVVHVSRDLYRPPII
ncbi:hypothetical protein VCHENC02_5658 [Vibrio harveyi]|uniref:DUF2946 domain-containing protein n=1 Tax=Vibrio harveyi TaxID=669 RepID=A0A454CPW0_VIBHA|nr:hypothetical protein VCHENC02_5658 [Vibrio harveyi]